MSLESPKKIPFHPYRFGMKSLAHLLALVITVGCWHTVPSTHAQQPENPTRASAIQTVNEDLRSMGIDPNKKRLTVIERSQAKGYLDRQPHNEYWDAGRSAVGSSPFYILTFSEPKPSLGGAHQYFIHAETHRRLWVARSK